MGYTVRVSNVSQKATERDIYDFFAFSGEISSIQTRPSTDVPGTQEAYVTFHEERSLETALLLTGAVIADRPVTVELAEGYQPPPTSHASSYGDTAEGDTGTKHAGSGDTFMRAESMMASLLANGYILGKDAMERARALDNQHEISAKAKLHAETLSRSAAEIDSKYSISKKLAETSATFTRSLTTVDDKYHVTSKAKEAFSVAEASLAEAGQYVMKNQYVSSGTSWLAGAFGQLKTIVADVQQQAAQKVFKAEEERSLGMHSSVAAGAAASADNIGAKATEAAKGADSLGLSDHGPPIVGGGPPPPSVTSLMDAPAPPLAPAAAAKSALPFTDPPVF